MIKKSILPFLIIVGVAIFMLDFGNGEIQFEEVSYNDLPRTVTQDLTGMGPGGTGIFEYNGKSFAFITSNPNENVEVEFVGKAHDGVGKEVRYKVVPTDQNSSDKIITGSNGDYSIHVIKLEKKVSTPFGFYKTN